MKHDAGFKRGPKGANDHPPLLLCWFREIGGNSMCLGATDKSSYTCIVVFPEMDNSVYWRANPLFDAAVKHI